MVTTYASLVLDYIYNSMISKRKGAKLYTFFFCLQFLKEKICSMQSELSFEQKFKVAWCKPWFTIFSGLISFLSHIFYYSL